MATLSVLETKHFKTISKNAHVPSHWRLRREKKENNQLFLTFWSPKTIEDVKNADQRSNYSNTFGSYFMETEVKIDAYLKFKQVYLVQKDNQWFKLLCTNYGRKPQGSKHQNVMVELETVLKKSSAQNLGNIF